MSYLAHLADDGSVALPEPLAQAIGLRPGDLLSIEQDGPSLVIRRDGGAAAAQARLRRALSGYSVDRFLAERRGDWGE